jgi:(p)ppGpp synthase/HD superfamily hydrolase
MTHQPDRLTRRFTEAVVYCLELHGSQTRKLRQTPYIAHLFSVSALVLEDGGDEDEAIAALLHDALEDQPDKTSPEEIRRRFGERVLGIVQDCTDTPREYRGGSKPSWELRKQAYLAHLRRGSSRVALADKLHNARELLSDYRSQGDLIWDAFNAGKEQQLWFWRSLVEAFRAGGSTGRMLDELERLVAELEILGEKG